MSDEAFHEIQLNGKQLVFMFMAATVVAVVIFLCGVMVGRGVQLQRAGDSVSPPAETALDPTALPQPTAPTTTTDAPLTAQETLTYGERLQDPNPPAEALAPVVAPAALPPPVVERSQLASVSAAAAPAAAPSPPTTVSTALAEPRGNGWVVQVAAVRERSEAEIIAGRLSRKGYPAFITTPATNAARVFRVRVGKYPDRREAEAVSGRLEKEEQFKPWITR